LEKFLTSQRGEVKKHGSSGKLAAGAHPFPTWRRRGSPVRLDGRLGAETVVNFCSVVRRRVCCSQLAVLILLGLAVCSGCGTNQYPENLDYPVRTDPLVTELPKPEKPPTEFDLPGQFEHMLDNPNYPPLTVKLEQKYVVRFPGVDPRNGKVGIKEANRDKLKAALDDSFGTPRLPRVKGIDRATRATLKLSASTLERGSQLYRLHCVHCHGLSGNGRGPTAPWVNPHPRDYRQGIFKFTSSSQDQGVRKPRRADLIRTISHGVEGTSMPAFNLLPEQSLDDLASYVTHLSIRGQCEFNVMSDAIGAKFPGNVKRALGEELKTIADAWVTAQNSMIDPAKAYPTEKDEKKDPYRGYPPGMRTDEGRPIVPGGSNYGLEDEDKLRDSVRRGFEIFSNQAKSACGGCHRDFGRRSELNYDAWGTILRPANLTLGAYRGGRRPIDLYWRIYAGINGVNMPKFREPPPPGDVKALKELNQDIWDLVNFIQVLPYPAMREKYGIHID
jgi:mono/diheme cytochrome c family protein